MLLGHLQDMGPGAGIKVSRQPVARLARLWDSGTQAQQVKLGKWIGLSPKNNTLTVCKAHPEHSDASTTNT